MISKMVRDLNMPLTIVPCETVREPDGLAMSSRNRYLTPEQRKAAGVLSQSLAVARKAYDAGERDAWAVRALVEDLIINEPLAEIDYVAVADAHTLEPVDTLDRTSVVLLAVRIGTTRLIDNTLLGSNEWADSYEL